MHSEDKEAEHLLQYKDILYRIAFSNMKSMADAEDVVQEAFFRYLRAKPDFEDAVHEKAWLIRVVINICYDIQKSVWFSKTVAIDEVPEKEMKHFHLPYIEEDETLWRVMELPVRYRNPLYLFYYEDHSIKEIARILELEEGTVKTRLRRGRKMLRERILGLTDKPVREDGKDAY